MSAPQMEPLKENMLAYALATLSYRLIKTVDFNAISALEYSPNALNLIPGVRLLESELQTLATRRNSLSCLVSARICLIYPRF